MQGENEWCDETQLERSRDQNASKAIEDATVLRSERGVGEKEGEEVVVCYSSRAAVTSILGRCDKRLHKKGAVVSRPLPRFFIVY